MEPARILIDNRHKAILPSPPLFKKTEQILNALECEGCELSIVIMDDTGIKELNRSYRGIETPTNVLAFPMQEGEFTDVTPNLLGDVVISVDTARREATAAGITLDERMSQLLIHGILHLVGFDHETGPAEAGRMEAKSRELLRLIESNPDLSVF